MASKALSLVVFGIAVLQCCTWVQAAEPSWNITTASIQGLLDKLTLGSEALINATNVINNASKAVQDIEGTLKEAQDKLKKGGNIEECESYKLFFYLLKSGTTVSSILTSIQYPTLQPVYEFVTAVSNYNLGTIFGYPVF